MLFRQVHPRGPRLRLLPGRRHRPPASRRWSTRSGTSSLTCGCRACTASRIEHVLETHNHADHVSGHGRLARATGATIHVHELAEVDYPHEAFADGWRLALGEVVIEAVHTPGHRPEHTSFLLRDEAAASDPVARAQRRLAVRRRRRPPRPRRRARRGSRRPLPVAARAPVHPARRASSSGPGTWAARCAAARDSTTRPPRRSASSSRTTAPRLRLGAGVRRRRDRQPRRPPAARRARRLAQPRAAGRGQLGAPAPHVAPRGRGGARRRRGAGRRAHQRAVRRGPRPGAISASADDTGFATKVAQVVLAADRADRRRRLGRATSSPPPSCLAPSGSRVRGLSRRRDDRVALGGPAGRARGDRSPSIELGDPELEVDPRARRPRRGRVRPRRTSRARSTSPTPSCSTGSQSCRATARSRPCAAAASAAASRPRSFSARASSR